MLSRRIVAVSHDKGFGKQLAMALRVAGGAVDVHPALDAVTGDGAALQVIHVDGAASLPRLAGDCPVVAVLPRLDLASAVDAMRASDQVVAVTHAEGFDGQTLSAMTRRVLTGEVFGLEKLMTWGVQIQSQLVGDFHEKSLCISQIAEFVEQLGVPRAYRESIEQCVDEMLMNALYDAPVDAEGKPIFADVPTKTRIALRTEQVVVVQYACDGQRFAVSVRDSFGSLSRDTVLRVLHKCLHAERPVDVRASGAGVGLYLMASSSTALYFNLAPGVATEVVCAFDLDAPAPALEHIGFFVEQIEQVDAADGPASGGNRQFSAGPLRALRRGRSRASDRFVTLGLSIAIVATLVLIGVAAWSRIVGARRTEITFTTSPPGAVIEIDGRSVGTTASGKLRVVDLAIGRTYAVVARLDGYQSRPIVLQPRAGAHDLALELQPQTAVVDLDSDPSGATVEVAGAAMGTTPLTLTSLAPETTVSIGFVRPGYRKAVASLKVPGRGEKTRLVQHLEASDDAVRVRFVSNPPGAQVIRLGQETPSADRTYTPAEVLVQANIVQRFMLTMPNHVPLVIAPFTPIRGAGALEKGGDLVEGATLHIEAARDGKVTVSGAPHCTDVAVPADCTLAPGNYTIVYVGPGELKATRTMKLADRDETVRF